MDKMLPLVHNKYSTDEQYFKRSDSTIIYGANNVHTESHKDSTQSKDDFERTRYEVIQYVPEHNEDDNVFVDSRHIQPVCISNKFQSEIPARSIDANRGRQK